MDMKTTKIPRYYQAEAIELALNSIKNEKSNPLIVLPTGSGKTLVVCGIIIQYLKDNPNKNILVISHVKEILYQNYKELSSELDEPIGLYAAGLGRKDIERVTVVSMQTGRNCPEVFKNIGLVIVDEAHLINSFDEGTYRKFLSNFNSNIIGLTGTPYRSSGFLHMSEEALFTEICIDYTSYQKFNELTDKGFLAKIYSKSTDLKLDIPKGVATIAGDFSNNDLDILFDNDRITKEALKEVKKIYDTKKYKKILIFCINIKHSELVSKMMNDIGIKTGFVHSKMENDRFQEIEDFRNGKLEAITNVNTLTTGLDIPDIDLLIMLRPTKSLSLYQQMVGRLLRPHKNKDHGLVLDFADNISRLGPINDVKIDNKGKPQIGGSPPIKTCPKCDAHNHPIAKYCIVCGYKFIFKPKLTATHSEMNIVKQLAPQELTVKSVMYSRHKKKGKADSFKISYRIGLRLFHKWLSVESNSMYAADYAKAEIPNMLKDGEKIDGKFTVENLLKNIHKFKTPSKIKVDVNEKYPRIESVEYKEDKV